MNRPPPMAAFASLYSLPCGGTGEFAARVFPGLYATSMVQRLMRDWSSTPSTCRPLWGGKRQLHGAH